MRKVISGRASSADNGCVGWDDTRRKKQKQGNKRRVVATKREGSGIGVEEKSGVGVYGRDRTKQSRGLQGSKRYA